MAQLRGVALGEQGSGGIREDEHRAALGFRCCVRIGGFLRFAVVCIVAIERIPRFGQHGGDLYRCQPKQVIQAFGPDLGLHHHAGAAADRGVIHGMMHVVRPVAQVVRMHLNEPLGLRLAEQTQVQHLEILREHGNDVDLHILQPNE